MAFTIEELRELADMLREARKLPDVPLPDETATPIQEVDEEAEDE